MGIILLAGGAEFKDQMAMADRQAIQLAGGSDAPVCILPTAAAPDNNHRRAGQNGVDWFKHLGATNVSALPLIDRNSANDPAIAETLSQAGLIYLLGGFPGYLADTLKDSRCWRAVLSAYHSGSVIAGSSAGAMVLCEYYYDPVSSSIKKGLDLLKSLCILPHHNAYGKDWATRLIKLLAHSALLGIDEETGVISNVSEGLGQVKGKGKATIYHNGRVDRIGPEREFNLSLLNITKPEIHSA